MKKRVFLSPPHMGGEELELVEEAFRSNYIRQFGDGPRNEETADIVQIGDMTLGLPETRFPLLERQYYNAQGTDGRDAKIFRCGPNSHVVGQNHGYALFRTKEKAFPLTGMKLEQTVVFYESFDLPFGERTPSNVAQFQEVRRRNAASRDGFKPNRIGDAKGLEAVEESKASDFG